MSPLPLCLKEGGAMNSYCECEGHLERAKFDRNPSCVKVLDLANGQQSLPHSGRATNR